MHIFRLMYYNLFLFDCKIKKQYDSKEVLVINININSFNEGKL